MSRIYLMIGRLALAGTAVLAIGAFVGATASSNRGRQANSDRQAMEVGATAASIEGQDTSGAEVSLANYDGKIRVIDFWATWCPPCREKIPDLVAIQKDYADEGVQVIGVSGDRDAETVRRYEQKNGINFPTIVKGAEDDFREYNVWAIPTTLIIDEQGVIVHRETGGDIKKALEEFLADRKAKSST